MPRPQFLADEDFRHDIVFAVRSLDAQIAIVTVQELGLRGRDDADLLEIAAQSRQIILSHDRGTMTAEAVRRLRAGRSIAGLLVAPQHAIRSAVADTVAMIANCSDADEWVDVIDFVPW